jgi:hypothetical protein
MQATPFPGRAATAELLEKARAQKPPSFGWRRAHMIAGQFAYFEHDHHFTGRDPTGLHLLAKPHFLCIAHALR